MLERVELLTDELLVRLALMFGLAVCSIGGAAVTGYLSGWTFLYHWSKVPMAANTAVAFFLVGVAIVLLSIVNLRRIRTPNHEKVVGPTT